MTPTNPWTHPMWMWRHGQPRFELEAHPEPQRQDHVWYPYLYPTHSGPFRLMKHRFICRNDVVLMISVFLCESTTAPSNRAPRPNLDCFFSIYVCFGFLRFLFIFSLSMFVQCPSVDLLVSICIYNYMTSAAWGPRCRRDNECRAPQTLLAPALFDYAM